MTAGSSGTVTAIYTPEGALVSVDTAILALGGKDISEQIRSAEDSLRNAQLSVDSTRNQLDNYTISSPIRGTVVDSEGAPVIGAGVVVVGNASIGAVTDANGVYHLNVPARASLEFSCIGYASQVIAVGDQSVIDVVLQEDTESLEETVERLEEAVVQLKKATEDVQKLTDQYVAVADKKCQAKEREIMEI